MTKPPSFITVAVDGGAASGKSSTSTTVADRCHFLHVDTGSHYRSVSLACLDAGIEAGDSETLNTFLDKLDLGTHIDGNEALVQLGGYLPDGERLRSEAVNASVSRYAALAPVRNAVKQYQRGQVELARQKGFAGIIMEGRDIGTVILPDADLKVFLEADATTREQRRQLEGRADRIAARDKMDQSRKEAPLLAADDAMRIDNSALSLEEVVDRVVAAIRDLA